MTDRYILDTGPLGRIAHSRRNPETLSWFEGLIARRAILLVPEIADYELRRELIRARLWESVKRLDAVKRTFRYVPIDTPTMLRAAEFWAEARNLGRPSADPKELDADVILAAQAERAGAVVLTENVGHLGLFVEAMHWTDIPES